MKYFVRALILIAALVPAAVVSQPNTFTLEQSIIGGAKFYPAQIGQMHWIPGSDRFAYVTEVDDDYALVAVQADKGGKTPLVSQSQLDQALVAIGSSLNPPRFPNITMTGPSSFRFQSGTSLYTYDWAQKKAAKLVSYHAEAENVDISEQGHVAYTKGNDLFVSVPGKEDFAVTNDPNDGIRYGEAAHRFEFGITKGTFWSPDGNQLAFYKMDQQMVTDYPIMDLSVKPAKANMVKYPFAGQKSHEVTLGVYNIPANKIVYLATGGDPEHYLTNITWSPDGKEIYVAELNRGQDHLTLNRYDAATGRLIAKVFEEHHDKYIEPKNGPIFVPLVPNEFLWLSQRDGFNHIYHYRNDGTLLGQLTQGPWMITHFLGFDEKGRTAFIETTSASAVERHVHAVDIRKKTVTLLTPGKGTHSVLVQPQGRYVLDNWTSIEVPRIVRVLDLQGKQTQEVFKAEDPLKALNIPQPKLFKIKAADRSTDMWARMFYPANFDEKKKYPVIVYVYNGPGIQLNLDTYMGGAPLWMPWAASQGYLVFTVDGRGSANQGLAFEQAIFRKMGQVELADQLAGVEYLKTLPYVDANRLAVHGWSYGGFMTCHMMLNAPGVFKAGVAGGPVIDWAQYEVMYTERYMDTPQSNPDGYEKARVIPKLEDLEGKLMLIHGTSDDVVVWQQSLDFIQQAISKGVQVDYFVYPNHPHNVRGKDRVHLMKKVLDYLMGELQ